MNVNLQTCDSCFKSETLSCCTRIHMFVSLDSTELPLTVQKKRIKELEEGSRENRIMSECLRVLSIFLGRLKAHRRRFKCDTSALPGPEARSRGPVRRLHGSSRGPLPPTKHPQTPAC